jgi:hypothetical protein
MQPTEDTKSYFDLYCPTVLPWGFLYTAWLAELPLTENNIGGASFGY